MRKKASIIFAVTFVFAALLYASRGPDISNTLKKLILPELELATGKKFVANKIYINILPLFVEMRGVRALDDNGDSILELERVKGYVGLSGLFSREIFLTRLMIKNPGISTNKEQLSEILDNVKLYLAKETKKPFKVIVKSIEMTDAKVRLQDADSQVKLDGLRAGVILSGTPDVHISAQKFSIRGKGIADLQGMFETVFTINDGTVKIKKLNITSHHSDLATKGSIDISGSKGIFDTRLTLLVSTVKKIFGLKSSGEGKLFAEGIVKLDKLKPGLKTTFVDVKVSGDLRLEALMELLKVKEQLKGSLDVQGEIKGYLNNLNGSGVADLKKGNLFGVDVDALNCKVSYKDGLLKFDNGVAHLYGGAALVEATLKLPVVNFYTLHVKAKDVNSKGIFKLIAWDPLIPEGKVSGEITSSGSSFSPAGTFFYRSVPREGDILDRVNDVSGSYKMSDDVISFSSLTVKTGIAKVSAIGTIDLGAKTLAFSGAGTTGNMKEFSAPYFTALSGPGSFKVSVRGALSDPELEAVLDSDRAAFNTALLEARDVFNAKIYSVDSFTTSVVYRKNMLSVKTLTARSAKEEMDIKGNIYFKQANKLFDLGYPDFDLTVRGSNMSVKGIADVFRDSPPFSGTFDTTFKLQGHKEDVGAIGDFSARNLSFDNKLIGNIVRGNVTYGKKKFIFHSMGIRRGNSTGNIAGSISLNKHFSFTAQGEKIGIPDLIPEKYGGKLVVMGHAIETGTLLDSLYFTHLMMRGEGTFEHPRISAAGEINGGSNKGRFIGKGNFAMTLDGKEITATAGILDGKLTARGKATLSGEVPWSADIDLLPARYDAILTNFMKELPDDLLLMLKGSIHMQGDGKHLNAVASIDKAHLFLYGTGFSNSSTINARLLDGKLSIDKLSMKSDSTELRIGGEVVAGKGYDLFIEGSSSLAPVKVLSRSIDVIKGNATFVFAVTGDWDKPKINGDMDITGGTLGLKGIHNRLSSVSAYIYVDDDRIVVSKVNGKISGGDISASGSAYLQRFALKRFFLESQVRGVTAVLEKDLWVNLDGTLQYRGTLETQTLSGDISVKKARYSERVEWKSWLLKSIRKERVIAEVGRLDMTNLNIRLSGSNLLIDNNVARSSMKMDLFLRGTVGQPILLGKIEATEGVVFFRNNEFKILRSVVDFSNPNRIHPYFDIVAETKTRSYTIRLSLSGYVEQFNFSISSDPPLNEADIVSLLTVGQIGKNLKGLEGGIGAGEATSFLTGKLQDVLEERLKTVTGFDRVQIDPYISKSTGTVTPRLTVAKRLMNDKLYVTYSTSVATGEEQVWKLEYPIGANTSLVGARDERGGLGGDVKFRFEFK